MKPLQKILELNSIDYYKTHLWLINAFVKEKLTPKEIDVLSYFMSLTGELGSNRFSSLSRQYVKQKFNLSSAGLSNYLLSLQKKGLLEESNGKLDIIPAIKINNTEQLYMFKLLKVYDR